MGCDIHMHAEKRDADGKWSYADSKAVGEINEVRSYALFGWLANVRNYSAVMPLAMPRGLPVDVSFKSAAAYESWGMDVHNASWFTVDELLAVDYDKVVEDRRATVELAPNFWSGAGTAEAGQGRTETLREFVGDWFIEQIQQAKAEGVERLVFWFAD